MRNIDMYTYKDKPFNTYRRKEIYPLNDPGFNKYISYESHNVNYLKLINPKVYKHILNLNDADIPEEMKQAAQNTNSRYDRNYKDSENIPDSQQQIQSEGNEQSAKPTLKPENENNKVCFTDRNENITKSVQANKRAKKVMPLRYRKRKLPPISVSKTAELKNPRNYLTGNEQGEEEETKEPKKLTLPEIMEKTRNKYKSIISNIHLINSKEFGPEYSPFSSVLKTGDLVRTNFYGAKFQH